MLGAREMMHAWAVDLQYDTSESIPAGVGKIHKLAGQLWTKTRQESC